MVRLQSIQGDRPIAKGARHGLGGLAGLEQIFFAPYRFERRYGGRLSCEPEVVSGKNLLLQKEAKLNKASPLVNKGPPGGDRTVLLLLVVQESTKGEFQLVRFMVGD